MNDPSVEKSLVATSAATETDADSRLLFRVSDTKFLILFAMLAIILLAVQCIRRSGWHLSPVQIQRVTAAEIDYKIDINRSSWVEWAQLPNIGETTARRIIADREANGPFSSVDDVARVSGIGPRTLDGMRQWITAGAKPKTH